MARGLSMAFLAAAIAIAALIQSSAAQTTYTVGDTTGWAVPPGANFYTSWAANHTFNVGDILVFNFMANAHDVAKVTKADYDACTTSSPISLLTTSPARITINASGEHYFLCNFTGHCSAGQKLMINVGAASPSPSPSPQPSTPTTPQSSPAPQPSTPTPQSSPAPQPSSPSSPAPQPSNSTPASSPSPVSTPPPSSTPASGPSPPSPNPASSPSPPPPQAATPPNSATSLGFSGFTAFISIFVALLF